MIRRRDDNEPSNSERLAAFLLHEFVECYVAVIKTVALLAIAYVVGIVANEIAERLVGVPQKLDYPAGIFMGWAVMRVFYEPKGGSR